MIPDKIDHQNALDTIQHVDKLGVQEIAALNAMMLAYATRRSQNCSRDEYIVGMRAIKRLLH